MTDEEYEKLTPITEDNICPGMLIVTRDDSVNGFTYSILIGPTEKAKWLADDSQCWNEVAVFALEGVCRDVTPVDALINAYGGRIVAYPNDKTS